MNGSMAADMLALLPEAVLVVGAVACLLAGSFTPRAQQHRVRLGAGAVTALALALSVAGLVRGPRTAFSGTLVVDDVTGWLRIVVALSLLLLLLVAGDELAAHPRESEVAVLLLLGGAGVVLLGSATDTAVLVVAFLLASIPLYGLVGLSSGADAPEAAMKTYLLGALSGILMMLGAAVLYGVTGATGYAALGEVSRSPVGAVAGVSLLLVGLLFEAGAVPVHFWVPDAVQGSWVTSAAFLTTVPKLGAVVAVARLVEQLPADRTWALLVAVVAAVTMSLGNLAALLQERVLRLLAWSTISQVGYLLAVAAAVRGSDLAEATLVLFLAGYAVTNLGCFAVVAAQPGRATVADWRGAVRQRPGLVAALGVLLLGLVGTPPTAVFVAKLLTLSVTWEADLQWLAVLVAANTVLSLAYYLRWLSSCLRGGEGYAGPVRARRTSTGVALVCSVAAVGLGVAAGPLLGLVG